MFSLKVCLKSYGRVSVWKNFVRHQHSEVKIPVPWGHVAGKWWNKNEHQPIISLHGWQDNANSFDKLVPLISSKSSVLAIDWPGHGYSSHFPQGFAYNRISYIVVLKYIVDYFGWNKISLMGHSLGGQLACLYSALYPDQVDALITLDIFSTFPQKSNSTIEHGRKVIDDFLRRDEQKVENSPKYTFEQLVEMVKKSSVAPRLEEACKILLQRGTESTGDGMFRLLRDPRVKVITTTGWTADELIQFCEDLKMNILCIKAESGSHFGYEEFFHKCWAQASKVARHAELHHIPGNHHVHLENADIVAPIINDFWPRIVL